MRYLARAPITVERDHRPGDTFEAQPKAVAHLVEAGHIEPLDGHPNTPPESKSGEAGGAAAPPAKARSAGPGGGARKGAKAGGKKPTAAK